MTETYRCRHCGAAVALADTNVATDIALCRACGKTMPFSSIAGAHELDVVDLTKPPKGVRVSNSLIGGVEVVYHRISPIVYVLIPFMLFWSGFSLWGIYGSQIAAGKFKLGDSLFGLPFLVGTIVLLAVITFLLFGAWRIAITRGNCEVFVGVGPIGRTKKIPLARDSAIALVEGTFRVNNVPQKEIAVTTGSDRISFGAMIPIEARTFIAAVLQKAAKTSG